MRTVNAKTKNSSPGSPFSIDELVKSKARHSQAQRARLVSPIYPDSDTESLLSLGLSLRAAGKDVQIDITDGVPASFHILEGAGQARCRLQGRWPGSRSIRAPFTQENREPVGYPDKDDAGQAYILKSFCDLDYREFIRTAQQPHTNELASPAGCDRSRPEPRYGGRCHPAAAGANSAGDLSEVQPKVLQAIKACLSQP